MLWQEKVSRPRRKRTGGQGLEFKESLVELWEAKTGRIRTRIETVNFVGDDVRRLHLDPEACSHMPGQKESESRYLVSHAGLTFGNFDPTLDELNA
ncbi:MAG TPA: hypothetical protein DCE44_25720 [Verrucomicrobiales bacterium]|nr:hypothetical protein [Verrucomicrobiales bacterium]